MAHETDTADKIAVGVVAVIVIITLFWVGIILGKSYARIEAIEAGVAHYEADPVTGSVRFVLGTQPNALSKPSK